MVNWGDEGGLLSDADGVVFQRWPGGATFLYSCSVSLQAREMTFQRVGGIISDLSFPN